MIVKGSALLGGMREARVPYRRCRTCAALDNHRPEPTIGLGGLMRGSGPTGFDVVSSGPSLPGNRLLLINQDSLRSVGADCVRAIRDSQLAVQMLVDRDSTSS